MENKHITMIDLGMSDTLKPELPRDEANRIARAMIAQGCLCCGTTTPPDNMTVMTEEGELGEVWFPIVNTQTGEERIVCARCYYLVNKELQAPGGQKGR